MKTILCSLILLWGVTAPAAYVTISATFTNRTAIGDTFTRGAVTVIYTNAPLNSQTWILTNSPALSATGLVRHFGANVPSVFARMTSPTNVLLSGNDLQFSIGANRYAVLTTNTATTTNFHALLIPWDTQIYSTNRTNDAEELIYGISKYARTNAFAANAAAMTNFVGLTNQQVLFRKKLTNAIVAGGTNDGTVSVNVLSEKGTNLDFTTYALRGSGSVSNPTIINAAGISGNANSISNGGLFNFSGSNVTITNFSAPGTGAGSMLVGSGAVADGVSTVALGVNTLALADYSIALGQAASVDPTADYAIAIGYSATGDAGGDSGIAIGNSATVSGSQSIALGSAAVVIAGHDNSVAIGAGSETTGAHQLRWGTAAEYVSIPGQLRAESQTNSTFRGSNSWNGDWTFTSRADASVIAGYVSAINLGTNNYVRITGASGAFTNASFTGLRTGQRVLVEAVNPGLSCVLLHNSSIGSPASTDQINTGTGALVNMTNNPALFELLHNGSKILVLWHSD